MIAYMNSIYEKALNKISGIPAPVIQLLKAVLSGAISGNDSKIIQMIEAS